MDETLKAIQTNGWIGAVLLFLIKEMVSVIRGDRKKLTETLDKVEKSVAELRIHVQYLRENRGALSKVQRDVDQAHEQIRMLKGSPKYPDPV